MGTNKITAIVLLVVGLILLYFGFNATDTPVEKIHETFTGDYTNQTMLYLIAGAAAAIGGVVMLLRGARR